MRQKHFPHDCHRLDYRHKEKEKNEWMRKNTPTHLTNESREQKI